MATVGEPTVLSHPTEIELLHRFLMPRVESGQLDCAWIHEAGGHRQQRRSRVVFLHSTPKQEKWFKNRKHKPGLKKFHTQGESNKYNLH
jgi:hypothetical protein